MSPRHGALLGGALAVASCAAHRHHHGHPGDDARHGVEHWLHLDDPGRDAWQKPDEVVAAAELSEGQVVADVGAGTGYFEPFLSRGVGARGKVLALDVSPQLVEHMKRRFAQASLGNVEVRLTQPDDPGLAAGSVDRVLVVDTWHHLGDRVAYARRLKQALAPQGRVLVVDYTAEATQGPPPEMRLGVETVLAELREAGFSARVLPETLPHQFIVVAQ